MAIAFTILLVLAGLFLYVPAINAPEIPPIPEPGRCLALVGEPGQGRSWMAQQIVMDADCGWYSSARAVPVDSELVILIPSFKPQFRSEMEALKTLLTENGGRSVIIIMSPADADFMGDDNRRVTFAQVPA